jgi:opacity protein-like surface antigen
MNQKKLILLGLLLLFLTSLYAQQAPPGGSRWSVSLLAGASIPVGKFGGKDLADSTKSFAQVGPSINLQLNYRLHSCFGLSLLLSGQENSVNSSAMEQEIEKANPGEYSSISSGKWEIAKIMAGPTFFHAIGKGKWELTVKGMAGALKTAQPQMTIAGATGVLISGGYVLDTGSYSSISFEDYSSKRPAPWAFSWLAGAGLRFRINDHWSFLTDIDYSAAAIKTPFIRSGSSALAPIGSGTVILTGSGTTPPPVIGQPGSLRYYSLPITSLSAHFGMEFRF